MNETSQSRIDENELNELRQSILSYDSYSRLPYLLSLQGFINEHSWLTLLGEIWEICDNIGCYIEALLDSPFGLSLYGGAITEIMNEDEQVAYDALPEIITLYRGCYQNNKLGFSWSLEADVARKFPQFTRYRQDGQPLLVKATAKKTSIAAIKLGRGEAEIITYRPKQISTSYIRDLN